MTSRIRGLPAAFVIAGALALAATSMAPASASSSTWPATAERAVHVRGAQVVMLPTGDQVRLHTNSAGKLAVLMQPAATNGVAAGLTAKTFGQDTYVIPAMAQPYLGAGLLDRSLFDITSLAAAARRDGHLAVRVSYSGTTPAVPGVTITAASAGVASGYLTPASAASFRTALSKRWKADSAAGWPKRTTLFGASRIAADVPSTGVVTPSFPMVTLSVKAIDPDGKPLNFAFGLIGNVDDARKYGGFVDIYNGEARVSVPKGNYSAVFDTFTFDDATGTATDYVVPIVQYAVTGSGQTLTIDFRKATATPSVTVPKKASPSTFSFDWERSDEAGYGGIGSSYGLSGEDTLKIGPTAKTTLGEQHAIFGWTLQGPGTTPAYRYDLAAATDHVSSKPVCTFAAKNLAVVKDRFFTDGPTHPGAFIRLSFFPFQFSAGGTFENWSMPAQRTAYVGALGGTPEWAASIIANNDSFDDPGFVDDAPVQIPPGTTRSQDWMRGPIEAGIPRQTNFGYCYACRTATSMSIGLAGVTDSTPTHVGAVFGAADGLPVARFRLYQDAALIFDEDDYLGTTVDVPPGSASYRAVLDLDRRLTGSTQSTRSSTELTYSSASGQGPAVDPDWFCDAGDGSGCRVLPILQARLNLPTSTRGRLPAGTSAVTVSAARIQGAAASTVTSAGLEIRRPGSDWETVKLTAASSGKYTGKINNSSDAGQNIDVRITASDAGGSAFKETVLKAYTVEGA